MLVNDAIKQINQNENIRVGYKSASTWEYSGKARNVPFRAQLLDAEQYPVYADYENGYIVILLKED